jgi:hypothetical protein
MPGAGPGGGIHPGSMGGHQAHAAGQPHLTTAQQRHQAIRQYNQAAEQEMNLFMHQHVMAPAMGMMHPAAVHGGGMHPMHPGAAGHPGGPSHAMGPMGGHAMPHPGMMGGIGHPGMMPGHMGGMGPMHGGHAGGTLHGGGHHRR